MSRVVRAALTETRNAFADMPARVDDLGRLAGRMEEVRAANVEHHIELIARAAAAGAQVIGLGELFTAPYFALDRSELWFELAEDAAAENVKYLEARYAPILHTNGGLRLDQIVQATEIGLGERVRDIHFANL